MNIKSLAHACIRTTDLEKTSKFYCELLGLKKHFNFTKKGKVIGFYLKASENTFIEVFLVNEPKPSTPAHQLSHFCLETDAIEDLWKKLADAGYEPKPLKKGSDKSDQFWVKDPNGIEMEFQQYNPQSSQITQKDVEVNW